IVAVVPPTICLGAEQRSRLSIEDAGEVVRQLLPDYCGVRGKGCSFATEPRAICPFEMYIGLPSQLAQASGLTGVWIGLDERKRPIAIASHKKYGAAICANLKQAI